MICTDDAKDEGGKVLSPGSWRLAPLLETFIHEAPHKPSTDFASDYSQASKVRFHYHKPSLPTPQYLVDVNAEQGARDVFKAVNYIFDEEVDLERGVEAEDVICDITGLRLLHSVGMVLACLPLQRRIQYTSALQTPFGYIGNAITKEIRPDRAWLEAIWLGALSREQKD